MTAKTMDIPVVTYCCNKEVVVIVPTEGYKAWRDGELIQRAMPELTPNERELLMSRICSPCWNKLFGH